MWELSRSKCKGGGRARESSRSECVGQGCSEFGRRGPSVGVEDVHGR